MKYKDFYNQCLVFGKSDLPIEEKWKSIKYINTSGQSKHTIDVQMLLASSSIEFINETNIAGFAINETDYSYIISNIQNTFLSLDDVLSISFVGTEDNVDKYVSRIDANKTDFI